MPQLVKGGKYVFGWSLVQKNGRIAIPEEAYLEYEFNSCNKIVIISGSLTSGGFSISRVNQLKKGPLKEILTLLKYSEETKSFEISELKLIEHVKNRFICWVRLYKDKHFTLLPETLTIYGIKEGDRLLVCRGSGYALGFIVKGSIVETAKKHSELMIFR
ncbi:MAG: hypothetical protein ACFFDC_16975 [Promethearchaeota archaeon]